MENHIKKKQFNTLFMIEMWERFAFYTFNGLFVLFAVHSYFNEASAYLVFGIFMALAYGLPTVGGFIADNLIGIKRTLIMGAVVLVFGYFLLALADSYTSTLFALSVIAVGNALFKPNPSALIGMIYRGNSAETNSAFTMYYMAINIGSLIATLFSPIVAKYTSFSVAFWIAFIGMSFALLNFLLRMKIFKDVHNHIGREKLRIKRLLLGLLIIIILIIFSYFMLQFSDVAFYIVVALTILCYGYLLVSGIRDEDKVHKIKQILGVFIFIQAMLFFIIYTQMFSTLIIFAQNNINLSILGFEISPASFTALNPFWILILSPILAKSYVWLDKRGIKSLTTDKYAIAMYCCAFAFFTLIVACYMSGSSYKISGAWMIVYYFLTSFAELLISAIGLSVAAQYFPVRKLSFAMGAWLLAQGCGNALAGKLAGYVALPSNIHSSSESMAVYMKYFYAFAISCLILAIVFTIVAFIVRNISRKKGIAFS